MIAIFTLILLVLVIWYYTKKETPTVDNIPEVSSPNPIVSNPNTVVSSSASIIPVNTVLPKVDAANSDLVMTPYGRYAISVKGPKVYSSMGLTSLLYIQAPITKLTYNDGNSTTTLNVMNGGYYYISTMNPTFEITQTN